MTTRDVLWSDITGTYAAILAHPFVTGLTDGSLPREAFRHYVVQDALYLRGYARALAACAATAPDEDTTVLFAGHSAHAIAAERELHAGLLADLGDTSGGEAGPTTTAYVSYLTATAHSGSFAEALGAVLPCYWIYARVGAHLAAAGSPDPLYARWIAMYGGADFQAVVAAVLAVTDRVGAGLGPDELGRMRRHVTTTARYEWMFWDAAWRREAWPV
jgi:thiaminase (transcriptional activator TenA)